MTKYPTDNICPVSFVGKTFQIWGWAEMFSNSDNWYFEDEGDADVCSL